MRVEIPWDWSNGLKEKWEEKHQQGRNGVNGGDHWGLFRAELDQSVFLWGILGWVFERLREGQGPEKNWLENFVNSDGKTGDGDGA